MSDDRKAQIVEAAYRILAEKGFEGFRTRAVADMVGINIATLHYHFPTKADVIQGVVDSLVTALAVPAPGPERRRAAVEELRAEYDDVLRRLRQTPEMFGVLAEITLRSKRDPALAVIVEAMNQQWRTHLVGILKRGVRDGSFRASLDVTVTATAIMIQLRGLTSHLSPSDRNSRHVVDTLAGQMLLWCAASPPPAKKRSHSPS